MSDPYDLQRFVTAQAPVFPRVMEELTAGQKQTHWMWFVFPQIAGLGSSAMAMRYAIGSRKEAEAYLQHDILGPRLRLCTLLTTRIIDRNVHQIFGSPDDMKFRSCMTLFACTTPDNAIFLEALDRYFDGKPDDATKAKLGG